MKKKLSLRNWREEAEMNKDEEGEKKEVLAAGGMWLVESTREEELRDLLFLFLDVLICAAAEGAEMASVNAEVEKGTQLPGKISSV